MPETIPPDIQAMLGELGGFVRPIPEGWFINYGDETCWRCSSMEGVRQAVRLEMARRFPFSAEEAAPPDSSRTA